MGMASGSSMPFVLLDVIGMAMARRKMIPAIKRDIENGGIPDTENAAAI